MCGGCITVISLIRTHKPSSKITVTVTAIVTELQSQHADFRVIITLQRGGALENSGEMIGWGTQGTQVSKNTNRNYIRTTRWSDGAHSVIDKCFEKSRVRMVEVSIDAAYYS